ncbi:MAG: hypothetical protein M1575_03050 [Patescibacteria group bacterium]|nr:hypothetical protein [Patescibacteria group bacterium]MCL5095680.1 hypothetical protein [Patescibacteria group bacterium]
MNNSFSLLRFILQTIICLSILAGGVIILILRISVWSLVLGLPMVQIGVFFLILSFDELARKKFGKESIQVVLCSVCGQPTYSPSWQNEQICPACEKKLKNKLLEEKKIK